MNNMITLTFDQFIEYGLNTNSDHVVDGIPWSFEFQGLRVTHENDNCYIIQISNNPYEQIRFNRNDTITYLSSPKSLIINSFINSHVYHLI